jgi:hypothetical protein
MEKKVNYRDIDLAHLLEMQANKQKAAKDLNVWLSRHENKEPEYRRVWQDWAELESELELIASEISKRNNKSVARSLNESFEL